MTPIRRTWALSALALTLVLGACSTPSDVAVPTLEPQFGSSGNDVGLYVSVAPGGGAYVGAEEDDAFILERFDNSGKLLWSEYISGTESTCGDGLQTAGVHTDPNGNALVAYAGFDCEYEYLVINKYSSSGKYLSHKYFYVDGYGNDVAYDSKGNIFYTDSDSINKAPVDGSKSWYNYTWNTIGTISAVAVSSNGNVFVSGETGINRYSNTGSLVWKIPGATTKLATSGTNTVYAQYRTTVRKLDANGKQLWSKAQSGLSGLVIGDMTADANGNLYLTGKYNASSTNRNIFTRKLNSSGKVLWTKTLGTSAYDDARGIATVNGSGIYITGTAQGALAHSYKGGDNDGYVAKLSSSGNTVWKR